MLDTIDAAHVAGYLHGLIAGGLVFGTLWLVTIAVIIAWFRSIPLEAPDPDGLIREDLQKTRRELPPDYPQLESDR